MFHIPFRFLVLLSMIALIALPAMPFDKSYVELHLRLVNAWKVGNPSKPDQFYAFGSLWVDAETSAEDAILRMQG